MRRSIFIIALLVALAVVLTSVPAMARSPIAVGISNPQGSVLDNVEAYKARYGRYPAMFSVWSSGGSRGGKSSCTQGYGSCYFPVGKVNTLMDRGITPIIWWQPTDPNNTNVGNFHRYRRIIDGAHNKYIRRFARELKAASRAHGGKPIIIRFAHEATGSWFPWAVGRFDNTISNYKKAWRHLHKQFKLVGARKHARFLWSNFSPRKSAYPGDQYIDYVGFTVLNFGAAKRKWKWMGPIVTKNVKASLSFTKKPIILAEVASHYKGGNKARWIKTGYKRAFEFPKVKGILYLDVNGRKTGQQHPDWRLIRPTDGSTIDDGSVVRAYRGLANSWRYKGKIK